LNLSNSKMKYLLTILDFLCFAEMYGGSIQIGGKKFYRSSTVLFLTIEEI